ncbi:MAG: phytanoyl-CoA dioxygenase, partial [Pseudomonadota bacterium]
DVLFFNPALMHGAGTNKTTDIYRFGNLLQISSAFGRAMETINRTAMVHALYPVLATNGMDNHNQNLVIAASAEGYPFPTNLDRDPPAGGLAPPSQAAKMRAALDTNMTVTAFANEMADHDKKRFS